MTTEVKNLCDKIESLMASYCDNNHDLLYEKTMNELSVLNYGGLFINMTGLPLYRVRLNDKDDKLFTKSSDLNYAPSKSVCSYGRVNKPGQSMFYCSEFPSICNLELLHDYLLRNDIGHERYATCSKWEIKKDLFLLIVAIAPANREIVNGFTIRKDCFQFVRTETKALQKNYFNLYSLSKHFFLKNAKNDYNVYIVCSAIANFFTLQFPNIDGFIYPTVQGNTGYNIVLRPHTVDTKMIVPSEVVVDKWVVTERKKMTVSPNLTKTGHIIDDNIIWDK